MLLFQKAILCLLWKTYRYWRKSTIWCIRTLFVSMRFYTFEYQAFNGEINREINREFIGILLSVRLTDTTRWQKLFLSTGRFLLPKHFRLSTSKPKWRSIATPTPAAPAVSGGISGGIAKIHKRHKGVSNVYEPIRSITSEWYAFFVLPINGNQIPSNSYKWWATTFLSLWKVII